MKFIIKSIVSIILVISMLLSTSVVAFAKSTENYLSELRIVYANSYDEAKQVLTSSKLEGYQIFNENLNNGSGEIGVWLAYKTTTNVDDAITDIAIMQMGGGYSEGNYQQMIKKSKDDYAAMGNIYLEAIEYFAKAYEADNFLAKSAYRQLNFYTGLDNYTDDRLGDLLVDGSLTSGDLATFFLQGNSYVLDNVRSLLAMGVSYNEEGLTYLQRVSLLASGTYSGYLDESVATVTADDIVISDNADEDALAPIIAATITTYRTMFEELEAYESELNYEDEEVTELELKYVEYKAIAEMMRAVDYLNDQSLYDFCMGYSVNTNDYSSLQPLVKALNDGQIAMTKAMHYYDVVRYSMSDAPESLINEQITELETKYAEQPFNVYTGVDRDVYKGTFALTSAAYRADAYTDSYSLSEALFGNGAWVSTTFSIAMGAAGVGLFTWAIVRTVKGNAAPAASQSASLAADTMEDIAKMECEKLANKTASGLAKTNNEVLTWMHNKMLSDGNSKLTAGAFKDLSYGEKLDHLLNNISNSDDYFENPDMLDRLQEIQIEYKDKYDSIMKSGGDEAKQSVAKIGWSSKIITGSLYLAGAISLAYSAISLYEKIHDYYNPTYDVVPEAMVDLIKTTDGDRYIKYNAVLEATVRDKKTGTYHPGDLNAYEGQRWNVIYYTKSYEAGKPLLANFVLSNSNNHASDGYLPIHRFGEVVSYDLNKYNFKNTSYTLYVSVEQSDNVKTAADVPELVGSVFGTGFLFLAGGLGLAIGAGATVGVQSVLSKKKKQGGTSET